MRAMLARKDKETVNDLTQVEGEFSLLQAGLEFRHFDTHVNLLSAF